MQGKRESKRKGQPATSSLHSLFRPGLRCFGRRKRKVKRRGLKKKKWKKVSPRRRNREYMAKSRNKRGGEVQEPVKEPKK